MANHLANLSISKISLVLIFFNLKFSKRLLASKNCDFYSSFNNNFDKLKAV